jgi:hypothetical protein
MKYEIELARAQHLFYAIPQRTKPDEPPVTADEVIARRRSLRMVTDSLIHTAFLNGDVVQLMEAVVETMTATAGTCAQFGIAPDISDFLLAGKDLVEDARVLLDKGINVREYDQVKIGAAMLQCVCAGVCGILGLPYRDAMAMAHSRYLDADKPSREDFEALLECRGFKLTGASNDEPEAA